MSSIPPNAPPPQSFSTIPVPTRPSHGSGQITPNKIALAAAKAKLKREAAEAAKSNSDASAPPPKTTSIPSSSSTSPSAFQKAKLATASLLNNMIASGPKQPSKSLNKIDEKGKETSTSSSSSTIQATVDLKERLFPYVENGSSIPTSSSYSSLDILEPSTDSGNTSSSSPPSSSSPGPSQTSSASAGDPPSGRGYFYAFIATLLGATAGYAYSKVAEVAPKLAVGAFATSALACRVLGHYASGYDATDPAYAWKTRSYGYLTLSTVSIAAFRALQLINNLAVYGLAAATTLVFVGNMLKKHQVEQQ